MSGLVIGRRRFMAGAAGASAGLLIATALAEQVVKEIRDLKPGEFTWHPERQPTGPVAVVVSLPEQRVHVYRNGVRIAVSTCSTGKPGHSTPTGVFVVLQKDKNHHSSTYNNAPMPNMNRLTWSGVALHAGNLPGYPASHGCVRLPLDFSARLFEVTHIGTPVIIAGAHSDPWALTHPGMVLGAYAEKEMQQIEGTLDAKKHPADWAQGEGYPVTSVLLSAADRRAVLLENGELVAQGGATVTGDDPVGSHVFVLQPAQDDAKGLTWIGISHQADGGNPKEAEEDVIRRLTADNSFLEVLRAKVHPGMVLVLTDLPLEADSRTGKDFVIMS